MLDILRSDTMRRSFQRGMQVTANAVAVTLGPCARPVFVGDLHAPLRVAQTGLAVATSVFFEDPAATAGAALLRQAAEWAREASGDGTASAVAVAHHLVHEGINLVGVGFDPTELRRGIELALGEADNHLSLISMPGKDAESLRHVARTASADSRLADLIADIARESGSGSLVVVDGGYGSTPRIESVGGLQIEAGYVFPRVMTGGARGGDRKRLHRPLVLLLTTSSPDGTALDRVLDHAGRARRPLLVVTERARADLAAQVWRWSVDSDLKALVVELPSIRPGDTNGGAAMSELAVLTGARPICGDTGDAPMVHHLGEAGVVLADATRTLVVAPNGNHSGAPSRLLVLQTPGRGAHDGGDTRVRAERAARAVHAATLDGVVPGGGVALLSAASALAALGRLSQDRVTRIAFSLVQRALEEPFRQLVHNAGISPTTALRRLHRRDDFEWGGLVLPSGEVVDVLRAGIIDPLPVLEGVLQAASGTVRLMLTTEAVVARGRDAVARDAALRLAS